MAVSHDNVTAALTYLAADPHPLAVARFNLMTAENNAKQAWALAFLQSSATTNDARKATAELNGDYRLAKTVEAEAFLEVERHRARTNAADKLLDIYRTENANARAAERIR